MREHCKLKHDRATQSEWAEEENKKLEDTRAYSVMQNAKNSLTLEV